MIIHKSIVVLYAVFAEFVKAHPHILGILQDVETNRTVQGLLDLVEALNVDLITAIVLVSEMAGFAHHLIGIKIYNNSKFS